MRRRMIITYEKYEKKSKTEFTKNFLPLVSGVVLVFEALSKA